MQTAMALSVSMSTPKPSEPAVRQDAGRYAHLALQVTCVKLNQPDTIARIETPLISANG